MTELPYASSLEMACRQLPATAAFGTAAERLLRLALIEALAAHSFHQCLGLPCLSCFFLDSGPREPTPPAKRGSQSSATTSDGPCHGRRCCSALRSAAQILPSLCTAAQVQENLFFMRMVIAILHAVLPRTHGDAHPAISLWRDYWDVMVF
eukprot:s1350_g10.t1